jgi:hypothetical protein
MGPVVTGPLRPASPSLDARVGEGQASRAANRAIGCVARACSPTESVLNARYQGGHEPAHSPWEISLACLLGLSLHEDAETTDSRLLG